MPHPNTAIRFPGGLEKALSFTFDDGCVEDARLIDKIGELSMRATCNLNSDWFSLVLPYNKRMSEEETVAALDREYVEIACHGAKHADCSRMDPTSFLWDAIKDRANLERIFRRPITGYAYPQGAYSDSAKHDLERAGFEYARIVGFYGDFAIPSDLYELPGTGHLLGGNADDVIDRFVNARCDTWIWGDTNGKFCDMFIHSYELIDEEKWRACFDRLERLAHHDDVWYATNIEVVRYIKAYRSLVFSLEHEYVYNPSCIPVWIYTENGTAKIGPGETVSL